MSQPVLPLNASDLDIYGRTILHEAGADRFPGMAAVAWAIRNRVEADLLGDGKPDWWGETYREVCLAKAQFSCWDAATDQDYLIQPNKYDDEWLLMAIGVASAVSNGVIPDPTGGATHYFAWRRINPPDWVAKFRQTKQILGHRFYRDPSAVLPGGR